MKILGRLAYVAAAGVVFVVGSCIGLTIVDSFEKIIRKDPIDEEE